MRKKLNLIGQKFGRLTVLTKIENDKKYTQWLCLCDCGNTIIAEGQNLKRGLTTSCGCFRKELMSNLGKKNKKYNMEMGSISRIMNIWNGIKQRCNNKNNKSYKNYGGNGITICNEWANNFETFYNWSIRNGYKNDLTIDRIDVNGDYEPSNCRWATIKEQERNKRTNHNIYFNGETHCIVEWAEILGVNKNTIFTRINRGWSIKRTLTTPPRRYV